MEMDYSFEGQKKFYRMIENKKKEVESFDIPDSEKEERYIIIDGELKRYNENKINSLNNQVRLAHVKESIKKSERHLRNLSSVLESSILFLKMFDFELECMKKEKDERGYE